MGKDRWMETTWNYRRFLGYAIVLFLKVLCNPHFLGNKSNNEKMKEQNKFIVRIEN
jgi:hypothetical protein